MPQVELSRLRLAPAQLAELQALLQHHVPHAEVWAYGSRVTGMAHEGSDLDLVFHDAHDVPQNVEGWDELKNAVQDSPPVLADIHLWSRLPAPFHAEIANAYVVIQQAGANKNPHGMMTCGF